MAEKRLDVEALVAALNAKREAARMSWRQLAHKAGVSPSTLTRMQQGKLPDVNTFGALVEWLGAPAEEFLTEGKSSGRQRPNAFVLASTLLRGKRELSPQAREALDELVQAAVKLSKEFK